MEVVGTPGGPELLPPELARRQVCTDARPPPPPLRSWQSQFRRPSKKCQRPDGGVSHGPLVLRRSMDAGVSGAPHNHASSKALWLASASNGIVAKVRIPLSAIAAESMGPGPHTVVPMPSGSMRRIYTRYALPLKPRSRHNNSLRRKCPTQPQTLPRWVHRLVLWTRSRNRRLRLRQRKANTSQRGQCRVAHHAHHHQH